MCYPVGLCGTNNGDIQDELTPPDGVPRSEALHSTENQIRSYIDMCRCSILHNSVL